MNEQIEVWAVVVLQITFQLRIVLHYLILIRICHSYFTHYFIILYKMLIFRGSNHCPHQKRLLFLIGACETSQFY